MIICIGLLTVVSWLCSFCGLDFQTLRDCCEYTDIFPFFLFIIYSLNYFPDIFLIYLFKTYYLEVTDIFLHFSH